MANHWWYSLSLRSFAQRYGAETMCSIFVIHRCWRYTEACKIILHTSIPRALRCSFFLRLGHKNALSLTFLLIWFAFLIFFSYLCSVFPERGLTNDIKRRLLTLVLAVRNFATFKNSVQNNATIDVCVGYITAPVRVYYILMQRRLCVACIWLR